MPNSFLCNGCREHSSRQIWPCPCCRVKVGTCCGRPLHKDIRWVGTSWRCTSCLLEAEDIQVLCRDCKKLVLLKDSVLVVNSENMHSRVCEECGPAFFKEKCGVCKELKLKSHFKYKITDQQKKNGLARCIECYTCLQCHKELDGHKFDPKMKICRNCAGSFKACPVCKEMKDRDLMFAKIWKESRCISCEFCVRCENHKSRYKDFKGHDNTCVSCRTAEELFLCAVDNCCRELRSDDFDMNILVNAKQVGRLLVCKACTEKGYSPKDVVPYECQSSEKDFAGHLSFEIRTLDNFKRKRTNMLICLACASEKESQHKPCKRKRGNEDSATAEVICDMHCDEGMKLVRNRFSKTTLKNLSKTSFRSCRNCQERRDELQQQIRGTKIKCDCRGGIHEITRERCAIFHQRLSHSWPGKDCNLTLDDVQFLKRLPSNSTYAWWHKLWGRSCKAAECF